MIREIVTRLKRLWAISKNYDRQLAANAKAVRFVNDRISDHVCSVNARLRELRKENDGLND